MINFWIPRKYYNNKAIVWQWAWSMHQPKPGDYIILEDQTQKEIEYSIHIGYKLLIFKVWYVTWAGYRYEKDLTDRNAA